MKEKTDLGIVLLAASALLFSLNYLTQCSSTAHRTEPAAVRSAAPTRAAEAEKEERDKGKVRRKSAAEAAEEEEKEERARIQNVGHALQTMGANPEYRQTYGIPR